MAEVKTYLQLNSGSNNSSSNLVIDVVMVMFVVMLIVAVLNGVAVELYTALLIILDRTVNFK